MRSQLSEMDNNTVASIIIKLMEAGHWETLKRMLRALDLKMMEREVKRLQVYDKSEISCLI